jgi:hypothetical protein
LSINKYQNQKFSANALHIYEKNVSYIKLLVEDTNT